MALRPIQKQEKYTDRLNLCLFVFKAYFKEHKELETWRHTSKEKKHPFKSIPPLLSLSSTF